MRVFPKRQLNPTFLTSADKDILIKDQIRRNDSVVYGARAMNRQMEVGILRRPTSDWDVYSKNPKRSARELERTLDKRSGGDNFYTAKAEYKHTTKVRCRGHNKTDPSDDYTVADFTSMKQLSTKPRSIGGVKYVPHSARENDINRTLKDPKYSYRHEKDMIDRKRIQINRKF